MVTSSYYFEELEDSEAIREIIARIIYESLKIKFDELILFLGDYEELVYL